MPTGSSSSLHIRSHRGDGDGGGGGDDDDDIGDLRSKPVFVLPPLQPCFPDGPNDVVLGRLRNSSSLDLRIRDLLFPFCSSLLFCLFAEIVRGWVIVGLKKRIHRNNNPRHGHTYSSLEKKRWGLAVPPLRRTRRSQTKPHPMVHQVLVCRMDSRVGLLYSEKTTSLLLRSPSADTTISCSYPPIKNKHTTTDRIVSDFQSRVLAKEWEKHQKLLLARTNKRRLEDYNTKEGVRERMESLRHQYEAHQLPVNERIDFLRATFADSQTAAIFETNQLEQKYLTNEQQQQTTSSSDGKPPCWQSRTNVAVCLQKQNAAACDDFIKAMELCVRDTVAKIP